MENSSKETIRFDMKLTPEENEILNEKSKQTGQSKASILKQSLYSERNTRTNMGQIVSSFQMSQLLQMLYRMDKKLGCGDIDGAREEVLALCDTLSW